MSTSVEKLQADIQNVKYNPGLIQTRVLALLDEVRNGDIDIVDATSPFIFALETGAVLTSAAISESATLTQRQYPFAALDQDNLYRHMSDKDFIGRFATPASAKFGIIISKEELDLKVVEVMELGIHKLTIPRNTVFSVGDIDFSLQYPIEIRLMNHGGYQIVYDVEKSSPLKTLSTNHIDFDIRKNEDGEWLYFEIEVDQFNIISKTESITLATNFKQTTIITDLFYYCRVYHENSDGSWKEINTTYVSDVFDIKTPTATIKVNNKEVVVEIPQIYATTGLLNRTIRIDIYQTKGPLNMMLSNFSMSAFSARWLAIDKTEITKYVSPLNTFKGLLTFSTDYIDGGSYEIDFNTLRNRVLTNSVGNNQVPITIDQLESVTEINGYEIIKNVDIITNRILLATRDLPIPDSKLTNTPANATIQTVETNLVQIANKQGVIDNGLRLTLTPDTIYKMVNGIVTIITKEELAAIYALPTDQQATVMTNGKYFYSPFHYVLDASKNEFDLRPYYLDSPRFITKIFVEENDTTLLKASVSSYSIQKVGNQYQINILTESSDAFKEISTDNIRIQLAFTPPGEKDRAYLNGVYLGKDSSTNELAYQFTLNTSYDLDDNNYLYFNNFLMYTEDPKKLPIPLIHDFDIFICVNQNLGDQYVRSDIEDKLGDFILPIGIKAISHEKLRIQFGHELSTLWARNRTIITPEDYKRHDADVPATYKETVYKIDPETNSAVKIVNGQITYEVLHNKGDPILSENNLPVYLHRKGDLVKDSNGNNILISQRLVSRLCDIFLIDGLYWFANTLLAKDYRKQLAESLVSWLNDDLLQVENILLELTDIYFYPKTTIGNISAVINDNVKVTLPAQQAFTVTLYVPDRVANSDSLKNALEKITINTITNELKNNQVSMSKIIGSLKQNYSTDVIDVAVTGFGGETVIDVATVVNNAERFSIKKKLIAMTDNTLSLLDDVTVRFVKHKVN